MKNLLLLSVLSLLCIQVSAQQVSNYQTISQDKEIKIGKLSNGMTYYIKHNSNPKGRGEFFIAHNVGALQEKPEQNGLAHFLEHMAFNGTKNFPKKSMLEYLNKIGVRFGYNVNAYTSKERTVYNISNVPLDRESVIDSVLLMLHDWSYYISCEQEEIDKERGVIREEWRLGDDARSRMIKATYKLQYRGSKYADRDVIGDTAVINNFKRETLIDFYHKWYRPDMQAIILSGDFDIEKMEKKIKSIFSKIPKTKNPTPKEIYTVPDNTEPIVGLITDPETRATGIKIIFKQNDLNKSQKLTTEAIEFKLINTLISNLIQAKLEQTKSGDNPPFSTAVAVAQGGSADRWFLQITSSPIARDYKKALYGILLEMERIKEFRFDEQDLISAKTQIEKKQNQLVQKVNDVKNQELVSIIVENFTQGEPILLPKERLELEKRVLSEITLEKVNGAIDRIITDNNRIIALNSPESDKELLPNQEAVLEMNKKVKGEKLIPYKNANSRGSVGDFSNLNGSKVKIIENVDKYKGEIWTLENGTKVYWQQNQNPNNKTFFTASSPGGLSKVAATDIPSAKLFQLISRYVSYGDMDDVETKLLLSNKDAGASVMISPSDERIMASAASKDLELMFQLIYLNFKQVNLTQKGFDKMLTRQKELVEKEPSDMSIFMDSIQSVKFPGGYTKQLKKEDLDKVSFDALQRVHSQRFSNGADFKFIITSAESKEIIKAFVEKYIGSINVTDKFDKSNDKQYSSINAKREIIYYTDKLQTPKSSIQIVYDGKLDYTTANFLKSTILKFILSDRYIKSIREDKGGTYHVGVTSYLSNTNKKLTLEISFETNPTLRDELTQIVNLELEDIIKNGITKEEFESAVKFLDKSLTDEENNKDYILNRFLSYVDNDGIDIMDGAREQLKNIKPHDIQKLLDELIKQGNISKFVFGTK